MENSSSEVSSRRPGLRRGFTWLFSWRTTRRLVIAVASLATVVALFYAEENWRGRRAWRSCQKELLAKGQHLDIQAFIPPEIPDEKNFAKTPFFTAMLDYAKTPEGRPVWHDANSANRAEMFGVWFGDISFSHGWNEAKRLDLAQIQTKLLTQTNVIKHPGFQGKSVDVAPPQHLSSASSPAAEILFVAAQLQSEENEIRAALQRPNSRFPIHYQEHFAALVPHLQVLRHAAHVFTLQAVAELALGKTSEAAGDIRTAVALSETVRTEPWLISALNRLAILQVAIQPLWEGLADHRWDDEQLKAFSDRLSKIDLLANYQRAMRSDLAFTVFAAESVSRRDLVAMVDHPAELLAYAPRGWIDQNLVVLARAHEEMSFPLVDAAGQRVFPAKAKQDMVNFGPRFENKLFALLTHVVFPATAASLKRFALVQTSVNQAIIACALERYRLAHGHYPEKLDELAPQFLPKIPHDLINGEPLKYHRRGDDNFILYSVGWDEKDDGGKAVAGSDSNRHVANETGDWVWTYSAK